MPAPPSILATPTRVEQFARQYIRHTLGKWSGQPFEFLPWQRDIVRTLFNSVDEEGRRQFRTCYITCARKQGKSTFVAAMALYFLVSDPDEVGAHIYTAAASRDQSKVVLDECKRMVRAHPDLVSRVQILQNALVYKDRSIKALSHDAHTAHGLNPSVIICDEIAEWQGIRGRDFYEVLQTSMGARQQPLMLIIGTAGYDKNSIAWELDQHGLQVRDGAVEDPTFAPFIYRVEENADWTSIDTLRQANPSLGQTVSEKYLLRQIERARTLPAFQNNFLRLHANLWTEAETRFIGSEQWSACGLPVDAEQLKGRPCYGGLDLSTTTDLSAFVLVFPPEDEDEPFRVLPFFWCPQENVREREMRDRVQYSRWSREGHLTLTPGNVIDHNFIIEKIQQLGKEYEIREINFDRWGSVTVSSALLDAGFEMVQFGQGYKSLSPPTKELLNLILSKRIAHGNNPVLSWNAANLVVKMDEAGNIKPAKDKSREKIDGIVALIMALDSAVNSAARPKSWGLAEMFEAFDSYDKEDEENENANTTTQEQGSEALSCCP